jgi:hypothetical protein
MSRDILHELIDRIPEHELAAARRYLEDLATSPAYRVAPDEVPVTEGDSRAIEKATDEIQAGKVVPHEEILREFGLE